MKDKKNYHLDRLTMMGAAALGAYVTKCGRGWQVEIDGSPTPTVFKTKTEALKHAEARVYAIAGRYTEPYMYTAAVRPQHWLRPANCD